MLAQFIGIVAMIFSILSFQCKTRKRLLVMQTITVILFGVHYLMLGAVTGAALNATSVVRNLIFYNKDKRFFSEKIWMPVFVGMNIIMGIMFWQSWLSVFFIIGMVFNTISMSLSDSQKVRGMMLVSSPFILLYSLLSGSIGGVVNELLSEASMITGILKYRKNAESC